MKLVLCPTCGDIFLLQVQEPRHCKCKSSMGMYLDNERAVVAGDAVPFGISNYSFRNGFVNRDVFAGFFYGNAVKSPNIKEITIKEYEELVRQIKANGEIVMSQAYWEENLGKHYQFGEVIKAPPSGGKEG